MEYFPNEEENLTDFNNSIELEYSEGLFGGMIDTELIKDFDPISSLLDQSDDNNTTLLSEKEYYHRFTDWCNHVGMKLPEEECPSDIPEGALLISSVENGLSMHSMEELLHIEGDTASKLDKQCRAFLHIEDGLDINLEDQCSKGIDNITGNEKTEDEQILKTKEKVENLSVLDSEKVEYVDIVTVEEQIPVLEAGDLDSLLEQFEATEAVNGNKTFPSLEKQIFEMTQQQVPPQSPMLSSNNTFSTNRSIRESLPKEIIARIKGSKRKKVIPVIPAIPPKKGGKGCTRMQDAGSTLNRHKLLKLITNGNTGELVQLDHDYCSNSDNTLSQSSYQSDSSEISSQSSTPDVGYTKFPDYSNLKPMEMKFIKEKFSDKSSRKDSGLESGDVSDASEETQDMKEKVLLNKCGFFINKSGVSEIKEVTMVSVLKNNLNKTLGNLEKPNEIDTSTLICNTNPDLPPAQPSTVPEVSRKKRLNLEEYRMRREEREKKRSLEAASCNLQNSVDSAAKSGFSQEGCIIQKPEMHSVEVQTQTNDFIEDTIKTRKEEPQHERDCCRDKRGDGRRRSYRARHFSSSSSCCSEESNHCWSSRKKRRDSRSERYYRNSSRTWSRSRSRSSSRSMQTNSSSSSSFSRSRSRSRDSRHSGKRYGSPQHSLELNRRNRQWDRPRSPFHNRNSEWNEEKQRQIEERRVIYVGRIKDGTTKADLRSRFEVFGRIVDISLHFRENADNYGFVTFAYKVDAYEAVEHGNSDPSLPRYDLCFGGRRVFCKQRYADLDGAISNSSQYNRFKVQKTNDSFDHLLRAAQENSKMRNRLSV
uniref:RRM domain-containing protein n=1 Tax=Clastoptera arizonana TaxID=38151 RepID=A0A1B6CCS6_9HEMI